MDGDPRWCCTYLLDPSDPLFVEIGEAFIRQQIEGLYYILIAYCLQSTNLFSVVMEMNFALLEKVKVFVVGKGDVDEVNEKKKLSHKVCLCVCVKQHIAQLKDKDLTGKKI